MEERCIELVEKYLPDNLQRHTRQVKDLAVSVGNELVENGTYVNIELLEKAAWLHDLFKPCDYGDEETCRELGTMLPDDVDGKRHAELAYLAFKDDYPELAKVIKKHAFREILKGFDSIEEKILYYADKRVMHDRVVSLKERLDELHKRYNNTETLSEQKLNEIRRMIFALEKELFQKMKRGE